MNSYNENLQANIVGSLQSQELEQKKMEAQLNASMFTLYYAEGARIAAGEKLDSAFNLLKFQRGVKEQAVHNSSISTNLLASAQQQKKYVAQAVANSSVSAANLQALSNKIVRLSGDIGNIFSIVNAADFGTQICQQVKDIYEKISSTAYLAEKTSLNAMDASKLIAEVSSSSVADQAKSTNDIISGLLKVVSSEFDNTAALVIADNAAFASASVAEKQAEGIVEDANVEYHATQKAYQLNIRELNLDLRIAEKSNIGYKVGFSPFRSPFHDQLLHGEKPDAHYPVKDYYIMLVKDNQKTTFSIAKAEALLMEGTDQALKVSLDEQKYKNKIVEQVFISQLNDSDGDPMELGKSYVVFVMAVLAEEYKKMLNNFDDYLSAPSEEFALVNTLASVKSVKAHQARQTITFTAPDDNDDYNVEYRCMFLPDNRDLVVGLLTANGLQSVELEAEKLARIAEEYDPKIAELEAEIISIEATIESIRQQQTINTKEAAENKKENDKTKAPKDTAKLKEELKTQHAALIKAKKALDKNLSARKAALSKLDPAKPIQPGFFFNQILAEQVLAGNYTTPEPLQKKGKDYELKVDASITDNFGSPLISGKKYIPAVLTVLKAEEENQDQFISALSKYSDPRITDVFIYEDKKLKN